MDLTKPSEKYNKAKFYDTSGEKIQRKTKFCPKCGPGVFMAEHKDRYNCGTCAYTEMKGGAKPEEKPVEAKHTKEPKEEVKEEPKTETPKAEDKKE